jgi:polo-like kinase 1
MPEVWVTKWIDYSSRYGVAYQLHDGSIGVYFNDSTKIISAPDGSLFQYIPRSTAEVIAERTCHTFENYPSELQKKVTLLKHFRSSIIGGPSTRRDGVIAGESSLPPSMSPAALDVADVYVRKWSRRGSAIMFSLSNKDIQVVFFDKAEAVLSFRSHVLTYTDKRGVRQSFALSQAVEAPSPDLARRLRYILSNLLGVAPADLPTALR